MDEIEQLRIKHDELLKVLKMVRTVILRECLELRFSHEEITQIDAAIKGSGK